MTELQSCDPGNARELFAGTFHDDTVLIKIHITAHIGHIAHHTLFVDNDLRT